MKNKKYWDKVNFLMNKFNIMSPDWFLDWCENNINWQTGDFK